MQRLNDVDNQMHFYTGTIIRVYNVKRFDVIKSEDDFSDNQKKSKDYYDFMLVDVSTVAKGVFILINITSNSNNKGSVFSMFENIDSKGWIKAKVIKEYFGDELEAFIVE